MSIQIYNIQKCLQYDVKFNITPTKKRKHNSSVRVISNKLGTPLNRRQCIKTVPAQESEFGNRNRYLEWEFNVEEVAAGGCAPVPCPSRSRRSRWRAPGASPPRTACAHQSHTVRVSSSQLTLLVSWERVHCSLHSHAAAA